MSVRAEVSQADLARLKARLAKVAPALKVDIKKEMQLTVLRVQKHAKIRVKDQSNNLGQLASSIAWEISDEGLEGSVGTRVHYAKFIEFGTVRKGRNSRLTDLANEARKAMGYEYGPGGKIPPPDVIARWMQDKGIPEEALWPILLELARNGIAARPFLFNSATEAWPDHKRRMAAAVRRALQ